MVHGGGRKARAAGADATAIADCRLLIDDWVFPDWSLNTQQSQIINQYGTVSAGLATERDA
jgi:hypothetical protein